MKPTIRQLDYLLAVEKLGSFVAAAEHCHVTQSTLSAGIKELETILGQSVIERGRKKAVLTAFGRDVAFHAKSINDEIAQIQHKAFSLKDPLNGTLRLGIIPTIAPYILPDLIPALREKAPQLKIRVFENISAQLSGMLTNRDIDMALMAFPFDTPGMTQTKLFEEDFILAAPEDTDITAPATLKDIETQPVLLLDDGHCLRDHALEACKLQPPEPDGRRFGATSLTTLIHMVAQGYGVTLLPAMFVATTALPKGVKLIEFKKPRPVRSIGLAWRANDPRRDGYRKISAWIRDIQKS